MKAVVVPLGLVLSASPFGKTMFMMVHVISLDQGEHFFAVYLRHAFFLQYEGAFNSKRLQNYEIPAEYKQVRIVFW